MKQKKRNRNRLGQVETLLRALLDNNFVFETFFFAFGGNPETRAKKYQNFECFFFTFEMRGLGNGSRVLGFRE